MNDPHFASPLSRVVRTLLIAFVGLSCHACPISELFAQESAGAVSPIPEQQRAASDSVFVGCFSQQNGTT